MRILAVEVIPEGPAELVLYFLFYFRSLQGSPFGKRRIADFEGISPMKKGCRFLRQVIGLNR